MMPWSLAAPWEPLRLRSHPMLSASEDDVNTPVQRQLMGMIGKSIYCCSGPSMRLVAKLSNNYSSGLIAIATAEAMNIGLESGINP